MNLEENVPRKEEMMTESVVEEAMMAVVEVITGTVAQDAVMIAGVVIKTTVTKVISLMIDEVVNKISITQKEEETQIVLKIVEMIPVHTEAQDLIIRTIIETNKELLRHQEMIEAVEITIKGETTTKTSIIKIVVTNSKNSSVVIDLTTMTVVTIEGTVMIRVKDNYQDHETEISSNLSNSNKIVVAKISSREIEEVEIVTKIIIREITSNAKVGKADMVINKISKTLAVRLIRQKVMRPSLSNLSFRLILQVPQS